MLADLFRHRDLVETRHAPGSVRRRADGCLFADFGKAVFGTMELTFAEPPPAGVLTVHLGEKPAGEDRLDHQPGGHVRCYRIEQALSPDRRRYRLLIPPDARNTGPAAVKMPVAIGEVMPFRYAEIDGLPADVLPELCQIAVHYPFDDSAAAFACDNAVLNDVWELCKYSIKATSFCGIYVDGDRERIAYEADAYLNQLSHYCVDSEYGMARRTLEHFLTHPTWPTEWQFHVIFMAWTEYLYTGATDFLEAHYDALRARLLLPLGRADGLISTRTGLVSPELLAELRLPKLQDLVDWPPAGFGGEGVPGELDGCELLPINTVVNAFHYRSLRLMERIARRLGKDDDRQLFRTRAQQVLWAVNSVLLDPEKGIYVDGEGSTHSSLHANHLPLAFGLVPERCRRSVIDHIRSRGMACSVYAAQYLLDGLFQEGEDEAAFALLTDTGERSWAHMLYGVGSTMTLEAWDPRFKPNLDWNHAWGAAPANLIPRWVLGVQPLHPGCERLRIAPHPGPLKQAAGTVPTPHGPVHLAWEPDGEGLALTVSLPEGVSALVAPPKAEAAEILEPGAKATFRAGA